MTHRKNSWRAKSEREAQEFGAKTKQAIQVGDAERAGALAMFAIRWAKRSLGSTR